MTLTVSKINIYPVKSLKAVSLQEALVQHRGLQYDRRWMIVDIDNKFLSQRDIPQMSLFSATVEDGFLRIWGPDMPELAIPAGKHGSERLTVGVWGKSFDAYLVDPHVDNMLSTALETTCRLVYMPDDIRRPVNPLFAAGEGIVSFADGYPLLLIGEASLADLNSRLETPVPMNRFRPSLVISGAGAFEEDTWKTIRIGDVKLQLVKPCDRCVMTTIDQEEGERTGPEPLKTLTTYRLREQKVYFGMFTIPIELGTVRYGDSIEVLE